MITKTGYRIVVADEDPAAFLREVEEVEMELGGAPAQENHLGFSEGRFVAFFVLHREAKRAFAEAPDEVKAQVGVEPVESGHVEEVSVGAKREAYEYV